jgi:hypothetical protein
MRGVVGMISGLLELSRIEAYAESPGNQIDPDDPRPIANDLSAAAAALCGFCCLPLPNNQGITSW